VKCHKRTSFPLLSTQRAAESLRDGSGLGHARGAGLLLQSKHSKLMVWLCAYLFLLPAV